MSKRKIPPEQRFWPKVMKTEECWLWRAGKTDGYGIFWNGTRRVRAHVYSYTLFFGDPASGLIICHHCDNPPCVNPAHLYAGTYSQNNIDKFRRGRASPGQVPAVRYGNQLKQTKLTADQVLVMRQLRELGMTYRSLAETFNVNVATAFNAINKNSWRYI